MQNNAHTIAKIKKTPQNSLQQQKCIKLFMHWQILKLMHSETTRLLIGQVGRVIGPMSIISKQPNIGRLMSITTLNPLI